MKRILSIALAFAMLLSFAVIASAEEGASNSLYTITINNSVDGYTYYAYQIFSGDLATLDGKTVLTNIQWGSGVDYEVAAFQPGVLKAIGVEQMETGEEFTADYVASKLNENNAAAFAKAAGDCLNMTYCPFTYNGESDTPNYTANVPAGYYLIRDPDIPTGGAHTAYILKVAGNVTAKPKTAVPTIVKTVLDWGDSEGGSAIGDSADADIGDTIQYSVQVEIPAEVIRNYSSYSLTLTDTLSKGLTYVGKETYGELVEEHTLNFAFCITTGGRIGFNSNPSGKFKVEVDKDGVTTMTITIDDLIEAYQEIAKKTSLTVDPNKPVLVTWNYNCTLNKNAVVGSSGNRNDITLTYSNNPNGDGTGQVTDSAIVFTYQVNVNKVDQENNPLTGADFTLYKQVTDRYSGEKALGMDIKAELGSNVKADKLVDYIYYTVVGNKTGSAAGSTFNFKGIDDGTYVLVETTVPNGYNAWESEEFTIEATHNNDDGTQNAMALTELSGGNLFTGVVSTGILSATIENKAGTPLPSTGGMGTTIFYIVGTTLALGAAILLIAKKRVSR